MAIYHKTLQYHEGEKQPGLPVLKNNEQRRAWLRKYKEWGLWYEDENIGCVILQRAIEKHISFRELIPSSSEMLQ